LLFLFQSSHSLAVSSLSPSANKRTRTTSPQHNFGSSTLQQHHPNPTHQKIQELQQVVQQQAAEIDHLKSENGSLQTHNQKVEHENRILKRAVTIQQERQHQVNSELEGARRFKEQAEDRIRRLEQMNLTLQYQLQAQNSSAGNDFMGFRPPDVY
jgi:predicted RNase H-like nuclease (RuvC/YqgF family)